MAHFSRGGNFLKNCFIIFFYFVIKHSKEITNELPKRGLIK